MLGRTVSHYRIVSRLGTGGMGVVYAAEDTRLGRPVALKFVPEDLAKDRHVVERLRVEARAASGLNHPNICTIYDIGEDDGRPFIVMELVKGQSLFDTLSAGALRMRQVVDIGIQVADALDAAHARGILHRDIKPANLFLTERAQIKILDFGLAKLLPRAASTTTTGPTDHLTTKGMTLGTVAYMSPEQVTGEELDGRTDLFSLGVVLYECVTGHRPFTGKTSAVVFSAILNRAPVAPVVLNPETPIRLQEIINNCLEKDRELRYQDAAGLRADLRRLKRDLESAHTEVVRNPDSAMGAGVSSFRDGTPPAPVARDSSREVAPSSGPQSGAHSHSTVLLGIGAAVMLTAAASYFVWSRPPVPAGETTADTAQSQAGTLSQLALAASSLQVGNPRVALTNAEDVLRVVPDDPEAIRIRDAARATLARVDEAVARTNALLAAGDVNGATDALDAARKLDPTAPAIVELSARLVNRFKTDAEAARQRAALASAAPSTQAPRSPPPTQPARAAAPLPTPADEPAPAAPATASVPVAPPPSLPPLAAAQPPPAAVDAAPPPRPVEPPPVPPEAPAPSRGNAPASAPPSQDDDAAISRVIATYARAIETKDVALFRSVKPNLSPEEQRRIEEGFRAVTSQRVAITILSIVRSGTEASVRLRRRDTIDAGGRQQVTESQQNLTLVRTGTEWVIREIG